METSGGQSSNLRLNVIHFFEHQCLSDICGSLRELLMSNMCCSIALYFNFFSYNLLFIVSDISVSTIISIIAIVIDDNKHNAAHE